MSVLRKTACRSLAMVSSTRFASPFAKWRSRSGATARKPSRVHGGQVARVRRALAPQDHVAQLEDDGRRHGDARRVGNRVAAEAG